MKYPAIFVLVVLLAAGCSRSGSTDDHILDKAASPTPPIEYPTLVVDEMHRMQGSNMPTAYQFDPVPGIRLDAMQFHFTYGTNDVKPNIQLVGKGFAYRLLHPTETNRYVIDRSTMEVVKGGPFPGFRKGDHMLFAIGRSTLTSEKEDFWVSRVGQIEVK